MPTKRRYFVTYASVQHEVFPFSKGKQKFLNEQEQNQIFKRKKLAVPLQFVNVNGGTDFDFFKSIQLAGNSCDEIKLLIQRECSSFFYTGGDLIQNGSFAVDLSGWTVVGGSSFFWQAPGEAHITSAPGGDYMQQLISLVPGEEYEIKFTLKNYVTGGCYVNLNGNYTTPRTANGQWTETIRAGSGAVFSGFRIGPAFLTNSNFSVDDISVRPVSGGWRDEWNGVFSTGSGSFDFDSCLFEVLPEVDDQYRCILENWETKHNMFDLLVEDVQTFYGTVEECTGFDTVPCPCPGTLAVCSGYANTADMYADGWCVKESEEDDSACPIHCFITTTWWREVVTIPCSGGVCVPPVTGSWTLIADNSPVDCTYARCPLSDNFVYRGIRYDDLIEAALASSCSIDTMSSIFYMRNPDTNDPFYAVTAGGVLNYVTLAPTKVANIMISQKSDIIDPNASNPASVGLYSLKQFLDWARDVHNVYWDIVQIAGIYTLRMEHYSYFVQPLAVDLTLPQYAKIVKRKNSYSSLKISIPRREKWQWMDISPPYQKSKDFIGADIIYSPACSGNNEVIHSPEELTTDIGFIQQFPDDVSPEGFVMLGCIQQAGVYVIESETGILTGFNLLNCHHSWSNLHYHYHRWNRYQNSGSMNGGPTSFFSWKPNVKQVSIQIISCCEDVNAEGYVMTELGETILNRHAFIDKMELDFTDVLTLTLTYSL